jgi:hypothetical protein
MLTTSPSGTQSKWPVTATTRPPAPSASGELMPRSRVFELPSVIVFDVPSRIACATRTGDGAATDSLCRPPAQASATHKPMLR